MNWDKVNDLSIFVGFAITLTSFTLLYLSSLGENFCIINSFSSSITKDHTINVDALGIALANCSSKMVSSISYAYYQIAGLTISFVAPVVVSIIKKYRKNAKRPFWICRKYNGKDDNFSLLQIGFPSTIL